MGAEKEIVVPWQSLLLALVAALLEWVRRLIGKSIEERK